MTKIQEILFEHQDKKYADFQAKLTPSIAREKFIGVRVPVVRKIASEIKNDISVSSFLCSLPHEYYDENMLHGLLLSQLTDYDDTIVKVNQFLPFVDNWAVCDIMSPRCFKKHKTELLAEVIKWCNSKETYTIRFGIEMLQTHFLDDDFKPEYLTIVSKIRSDEYYVNMMISWFFATALAKQYDFTIPYIIKYKLDKWCHNKTIQKAIESYRISDEQKDYLRSFKLK